MGDGRTDETPLLLAAILETSEDAVFTTDLTPPGGRITSWSRAAHDLFGFASEEIVGQPVEVLSPRHDRADVEQLLRRAAAGERIRGVETVRLRRDGTPVLVALTVAPVRRDDGVVVGTLRFARDLTRFPHGERAARHLAAIVESSDDAVVSKDVNGIVTSWNAAAERMFGYSAAEIVGESIRVIIPADRQDEEDVVLAKIRRGERVEHFETIRRRKDGSLLPISLTVSPIRDQNGVVVGASKIARDIGDRKMAELERMRLVAALQEQAGITERLNEVGTVVTSELDRDIILQAVTDAAIRGTDAEHGVFVTAGERDGATPHAASLRASSQPPAFPGARDSWLLSETLVRSSIVRSTDLTADSRLDGARPYLGSPPDHRPARSYLAVPVRRRSGEVLGGLFFGHSEPGRFTDAHERLAAGIAAWASIALENARLYIHAQEASRLKDEFLATLSHELRTPLNAILGYVQMIRSGMVSGERQTRAVETIERNARSLAQIVEDVLDVSRIISGKMRLHVRAVDVPDLVRHAVSAVLPAADAKGIRVGTVLDPQASPVSGDPDRLQQVVWNLMSNAVKFTPKGGRVQVRLERVNSHVEIVVSDTGIGISPEFLPHVFERFRQADAGTDRERGGLGLGLEIARQVVEMHGGRIFAASAGLGQGATFRIELPLMVVHPEVHDAERVHPAVPGAPGAMIVPRLDGLRVLAVDDDRDALELLHDILSAAGAAVLLADSAPAALAILEAHRPDVIVADLGLPRMDGFELVTRIRAHAELGVRRIPAAALTAYARSEDRARALRQGFQIHLAKPVDPSELLAAVASLGGRTGSHQETSGSS